MSTAEIGRYAALAVGVGGGLGTVASGFVCDRIRPRARHAESIVLLILFAASIPTLLVTVLAGSTALALGAMFLFNICAFAWLGPMTRLVQRAAGPAHHALAIAFCSAFATLFSLSCGLPLIGFLSDALTASAGARAIGYALAMTIPSAALLAILLHLRVLKTLRQSTNV